MTAHPAHTEQLVSLKRIEGQVRGLQRMITEQRYCVDILNQIGSVTAALLRVQDKIFERHLNGCVATALGGASPRERNRKINEIFDLIKRFRKFH